MGLPEAKPTPPVCVSPGLRAENSGDPGPAPALRTQPSVVRGRRAGGGHIWSSLRVLGRLPAA